jgi:hypothetical protein
MDYRNYWSCDRDRVVRDTPENHKIKNYLLSPVVIIIRLGVHLTEGIFRKRITFNVLVDIGCLITFIPSLVSGLVLYFFLPEGSGRGSGWATYLGIDRNQRVDMHNNTSLVFAALLIIHLFLHWKFFRHIKALKPAVKEQCETTE